MIKLIIKGDKSTCEAEIVKQNIRATFDHDSLCKNGDTTCYFSADNAELTKVAKWFLSIDHLKLYTAGALIWYSTE